MRFHLSSYLKPSASPLTRMSAVASLSFVHPMKVPVCKIQSYFTMYRGVYAPHIPYMGAVSTCGLRVLLPTTMELVAAKLFTYLYIISEINIVLLVATV